MKCGWIFFDLEKASDCVDHNILMNKVSYYGVNGMFLSLIKSYLESRYQETKFNKTFLKWRKIKKRSPTSFNIGTSNILNTYK
jgi:hypothetical protein